MINLPSLDSSRRDEGGKKKKAKADVLEARLPVEKKKKRGGKGWKMDPSCIFAHTVADGIGERGRAAAS